MDHKPYLEHERERIVKAGGTVMIQRINGNLAVSRALGDFVYKSVPGLSPTEQLVSPEPDVYVVKRDTVSTFEVAKAYLFRPTISFWFWLVMAFMTC